MPRSQDDIDEIIKVGRAKKLTNAQLAYVLGTVEHETGNTFTIQREKYDGSPQRTFRNYSGGWDKHGRGYVQITHDYNYKWATEMLKKEGIVTPDLVKHPDYINPNSDELHRTIKPASLEEARHINALITVNGMMSGQFGQSLTNFVNNNKKDYVNARQSVNSNDRSTYQKIAGHAQSWERELNKRQELEKKYIEQVKPVSVESPIQFNEANVYRPSSNQFKTGE